MARTVNEEEYAIKRNEILDVAQRLVYSKGYEQMSIRDILDEIQISKGAFYHYFASKQDLLEALITRMQQDIEQLLVTIVENPAASAIEKIQRFFEVTGRWKTARKAYLMAFLKIWHHDDNAILRQKVQASMSKHITPWLTQIINQGVREGILTTPFPDQVGTMVMALSLALGEEFLELLLSDDPRPEAFQQAERTVAAYNHALEQLLGAPAGSFNLVASVTLSEWFT